MRPSFPTVVPVAFVLASVITVDAAAQSPTAAGATAGCTYATCALRVEPGWFSESLVRGATGEEVSTLGVFGGGIDVLKTASDSAAVHAHSYTRNVQRSIPLLAVTAVAFGVSASRDKTTSGGVSNSALAFGVVGFVSAVASATFTGRARRELARAIWWYNGALPR